MNIYGITGQFGLIKLKDNIMNIKQNLLQAIRKNVTTSDTETAKDMNKYSAALKETSEETKEATGASSAGPFVGPLSEEEYCDVCDKPKSECSCGETKKVEATEATGSSSSGSYEGPSFLAKSQSKKHWRGAAKPLYKGGKFVKVKKKCLKYPYCNQGDINALKLTELDIFESIVKKLSLEYKIDENLIKKLIKEDILKNMNI
jgi:hypothetical protein